MTKRTLFTVSGLSMFAILVALLFYHQSTVHAANPANATVGAIRWDGYFGPASPPAYDVGQWMETTLGPNQYHFKLPFYAVVTGTNSVQVRQTTQSSMDQDITYAKNAGIDYWAFVYYGPGTGMDIGRNLYDSSTNPDKSAVKYCFVIDSSWQMQPANFSYLIGKFAESNYQKVSGNRPLLYLFSGSVYTASEITTLRNMAATAGLGNPYIVVMDFSASAASSGATSVGADAISSYATTHGGGGPYSGLVSAENSKWNSYRSTGKKVIPWVTTGWDPRPRIQNPVPWVTYPSNGWTQTATPSEIANHLQDGLNWVYNNPSTVDANTVLMYAWNEFDEGGWLTPTLYSGTDRVDAIAAVLQPSGGGGGYTSVKDWNFNTNGNFESWTMLYQVSGTVSGGTLNLTATGADPIIHSPNNLAIGAPSTYNRIRIRMKNNSPQTSAKVYFTTTSNTTWDEAKAKAFTIAANSNFTDYIVDMSTVSGWTGTIKQIRVDALDTAVSGQTVNIDYIRITDNGSGGGGDTTAPAAVTNLAVGTLTSGSAALSWTAPGDDGNTGTATSYDIRYSTSAITSGNWASATQVTGEPTPAAAGSSQSFTVTGLSASTTYHFAIRTSDEVPNISGLSNVPSGTTSGGGGNLLTNGGFESGTTGWTAQASSIASETSIVRSGSGAVRVTNRTDPWGSAAQNVRNILLANGQGNYSASAWARYASGSNTTFIVINTVDSNGSHWFTIGSTTVGTSYTQLSGNTNITWTGTLSSALIYIQGSSSTVNLYIDDFSLSKT